jgi:tetratricopeptide (TPR) repeat protein
LFIGRGRSFQPWYTRSMASSDLERVRRLRESGRDEEYLHAITALAREAPDEVAVRIEAAYAHDRAGNESEAMGHYDAAWRLGVPAAEQQAFLVGYGSTLRNVGRAEEAVALLGEAVAAYPDHAPLKAFLALALHSAGHGHAALATMLDLVIDLHARTGCLGGYEQALGHYRAELLERAMEMSR